MAFISSIIIIFFSRIEDDLDHAQDISAAHLISKPSTNDMQPTEREDTSSTAHPSAKVNKTLDKHL